MYFHYIVSDIDTVSLLSVGIVGLPEFFVITITIRNGHEMCKCTAPVWSQLSPLLASLPAASS